eukprot:TRINITY_DN8054_c0_g1_i1.p1 TRINITY_DN8054_c0_g1~~TRINITY_DN8054_c0_g1_i1.p1  ORF type:complete len:704 (-),score=114.54 TRINITY_DN8054_c0_g1_i1:330-2258(-)
MYQAGDYEKQSNVAMTKDLLRLTRKLIKEETCIPSPCSRQLCEHFVTEENDDEGNPRENHVLYFEGVGTEGGDTITERFHALMDKGSGMRMSQVARSAYYLMCDWNAKDDNYYDIARGDQLIVMGFSRGAVEARLFCRALDVAGQQLVSPDSVDEVYDKLKDYSCEGTIKEVEPIEVSFLGVWDSVPGALDHGGITTHIENFGADVINWLHDGITISRVNSLLTEQGIPTCCRNGKIAQALSINERRQEFIPVPFGVAEDEYEKRVVDEVWFPGHHSDVGGGNSGKNHHAIANYTLAWMVEKLRQATGVALSPEDFTTSELSQPTVESMKKPPLVTPFSLEGGVYERKIPSEAKLAPLVVHGGFYDLIAPKMVAVKSFTLAKCTCPEPLTSNTVLGPFTSFEAARAEVNKPKGQQTLLATEHGTHLHAVSVPPPSSAGPAGKLVDTTKQNIQSEINKIKAQKKRLTRQKQHLEEGQNWLAGAMQKVPKEHENDSDMDEIKKARDQLDKQLATVNQKLAPLDRHLSDLQTLSNHMNAFVIPAPVQDPTRGMVSMPPSPAVHARAVATPPAAASPNVHGAVFGHGGVAGGSPSPAATQTNSSDWLSGANIFAQSVGLPQQGFVQHHQGLAQLHSQHWMSPGHGH